MHKRYELTGKTFGKLTVLQFAGMGDDYSSRWIVRCECGTEIIVIGKNLTMGRTRSCGCARRGVIYGGSVFRSHGMSKTPLYSTWTNIKQRCSNPADKYYHLYGGRGICVCQEWSDSFEAFHRDMASTWKPGLSIERIDVNGHYEPRNCTWIPMSEQWKNRRAHGAHGFDLTGQQFGDWTALRIGTPDRHGRRRWLCKCVCGTEKELVTQYLREGKSTGCGCREPPSRHRSEAVEKR